HNFWSERFPFLNSDAGILLPIAGCVEHGAEAAGRHSIELHVDKRPHRGRIAARIRYWTPFVSTAIFEVPGGGWGDARVCTLAMIAPEHDARTVQRDWLGPLVLNPLAGGVVRRPTTPHIRRQGIRPHDAVVERLDPVLDRNRLVGCTRACCQ